MLGTGVLRPKDVEVRHGTKDYFVSHDFFK
jgi:hypothetical protein